MGVYGGHGLTFRLCNLNFAQLVAIARFRHGDSRDGPPSIFIDSSWIARKFYGRSGGPIGAIVEIATCFTIEGFDVLIVCDGAVRHDSKRASVKRQSGREKARINSHMKRGELICKRTALRTASAADRIGIQEEIEKLAKEVEKMETEQSKFCSVGQEFYEALKEKVALLILSGTIGGGNIRVLQSIFQADTTIARACVQQKCDIAFMNDSDLAAHAGDLCIGISEFKLVKGMKKGVYTIGKASIYSASQATIMAICREAIHFKAVTRTKTAGDKQKDPYLINAAHPIFDGVNEPKIRALFAVAAGCDVFPGGVFGVAAIRIMTAIKQQGEVEYRQMLTHFAELHHKNKLSHATLDDVEAMLSGYVDAFLFEPANVVTEYDDQGNNNSNDDDDEDKDKDTTTTNNNGAPQYVWNSPKRLPEFIKSFALRSSTITIFCGPNIRVCKGVGCGEHQFLELDGCYNCTDCDEKDAVYCRFCILKKPKDEKNDELPDNEESGDCCFRCYSEYLLGSPNDNMTTTIFKTKDEMKKALVDAAFDIPNDMPLDEIEDLYDAMIETAGALVYDASIREKIPFPMRESSFIDQIPRITSEFQFRDGANFLQDPNLSKYQVIQLTNLLSLLVTYSPTMSKARTMNSLVPEIIKESAAKSRLHSGFRLIKRAIRHVIDPRTPPLISATGNIVEYNGKIGILMCHSVRASMKQDIYSTRQIFTTEGIVCCECNCKVGAEKKERIVCIHILPSQLMLSLLLHCGLAQHALYALASLWKCADNTATSNSAPISETDTATMVASMRNLELCTSSNTNNSDVAEETAFPITINECLSRYSVGTDNVKFSPPPPRDLSRVGPLKEMVRSSPTAQLAAIIDMKGVQQADDKTNNMSEPPLPPPDYNRIWRVLRAVDKHVPRKNNSPSRSEFVGFELLELRKSCSNDELIKGDLDLLQIAMDAANGIVPTIPIKKTGLKKTNDTQSTLPAAQLSIPQRRPTKIRCAMGCPTDVAGYPFHNIPPAQTEKDLATDSKRKAHAIKTLHRKIYFERCHLNEENSGTKRLRLCCRHAREKTTFRIVWFDLSRTRHVEYKELEVPASIDENGLSTTRLKSAMGMKKRPIEDNYQTQKKKRVLAECLATRTSYRYCAFVGCKQSNVDMGSTTFHRVPPNPKVGECANRCQPEYHARLYHRREILRRLGVSITTTNTDLRVCSKHGLETIRRDVQWVAKDSKTRTTGFEMIVPTTVGEKSPLKRGGRISKGIGETRIALQHLNDANAILQHPQHKHFSHVSFAMYNHTTEEKLNENLENVSPLDENVASALGISSPVSKGRAGRHSVFGSPKRTATKNIKGSPKRNNTPGRCVQPKMLQDWQVKVRTGFPSLHIMLSYIVIGTDGNVSAMTKTVSTLSWFEEWFVYFEFLWGRTATTWDALRLKYDNLNTKTLAAIYDDKVEILLNFRKRYPAFATLKEDEALKGERWMQFYGGKRPIMWDMTDLPIPKPADAEMQSNTHSSYYGGNVAKGGIGLQQCGWTRVVDLWQGAVTDTDYVRRAEILEQQDMFIKKHDISSTNTPFLNILDKGFRVTRAAWETGHQTVLQPHFAKADAKFSGSQTLYSASVASDRGGNERAVRLCKKAGFLHRGLQPSADVDRFCDSWLTWGFQVNFMYKPVL